MKAVWPSLRGPAQVLAVLAGPLAAQGRDVISLNSQVVDPRRPGAGVPDSLRAQHLVFAVGAAGLREDGER